MKMIVSDYDDTFYINDKDIKNNIKVVKKIMKNDLFVIATGRSYLDFQVEKEEYNIPYDYLIINHGATIVKNGKVLYNIVIENDLKEEILKDLKLDTITYSFTCSELNSRLSFEHNNLTKIYIKYNTIEEANKIITLLKDKYQNNINCFLVAEDKGIEIVSKKANKANAISYISKLEQIKKDNIYTIGDNHTDIEMVKKFNGSIMTNSVKELKEVSSNEYESVSDMIEEIMSNDE